MKIGEKINNLRVKLGLTQTELALRAKVTKGFISQLERDQTSPSVENLEHIVGALGTNLSDFFKETKQPQVIYPAGETVKIVDDDLGFHQTFLIEKAQQLSMEPVLLELSKQGQSKCYPPFEGEVFGFVLSGQVQLMLGPSVFEVKAKDSFYFEANEEFMLKNTMKKVAKVLWVLSPPNF